MSVFGERSKCSETPEKKIKIGNSEKKMGRGDFGGSVGAQQTDKILRMAKSLGILRWMINGNPVECKVLSIGCYQSS